MSPLDFGPLYTETDMSRFPVEPWNTASNLIFLAIIAVYAAKTRGDWRTYPLVVVSLPILFVGFIGGTIYHATRSANIWLYLDFMPIIVLATLASCYFWGELFKSRVRALLAALFFLALMRCVRSLIHVSESLSISIGYALVAIVIILPALLVARQDAWKNVHLITLSILSFGAALSCRIADSMLSAPMLPMGTHFLWHLFGGGAVFFLMEFMFRKDHARG